MKTIVNCLVLTGFIFSSVIMGADLNGLLSNLSRFDQDLRRQQEQLNKSMRELGLGTFSGFEKTAKTSSHDKFIEVPEQLKGRAFFHISCDCQDLVKNGHFCGSHALAHSVDIEQIYGVSSHNGNAEKVVQNAFSQLNIGTDKISRTNVLNIHKAATKLNLDHIFVELKNGSIEEAFANAHELPAIIAFKKLDAMRTSLSQAQQKDVVKHIFAIYQVADEHGRLVNHVALFSVIATKENLSITLHDNLNEKIKVGSSLFLFADKLIKFFIETNKSKYIYEDLVDKLVSSKDRERYLGKLKGYTRPSEREDLLKHLFAQWLGKASEETNQAQTLRLSVLNAPLKDLKILFAKEPNTAKPMIIRLYGAMIDSVKKHEKSTAQQKLIEVEKILNAIKKTSSEQKIFSLKHDSEAMDLFEQIQNLLTSLRHAS